MLLTDILKCVNLRTLANVVCLKKKKKKFELQLTNFFLLFCHFSKITCFFSSGELSFVTDLTTDFFSELSLPELVKIQAS